MSSVLPAASSGPSPGLVLADLALVLVVAAVCGQLARRLRQPVVLGEIVAGLALGPSLLGLLPGDPTAVVFPPSVRPMLDLLAQLGLALFMFGVGHHLDLRSMRGTSGRIAGVSAASVAVPLVLGVGLGLALTPWLDRTQLAPGPWYAPALFVGVAMAITAFPVLARIVDERMPGLALGRLALASAAVQDAVVWGLLAVVVALATAAGPLGPVRTVVLGVAFLVVLTVVVRPALAWCAAPERAWAHPVLYGAVPAGLLACAWVTDAIGLHVVFGAFLFGVCLPERVRAAVPGKVFDGIDGAARLLLPVFFVVAGFSVDVTTLDGRGAIMAVAVVVVACAGKLGGAVVSARASGLDRRESLVLGVLLNTRGLTELIVLTVGLRLGVLDQRMFTVLVVMAVVTTMATGPLIDRLLVRPSRTERSARPRAA